MSYGDTKFNMNIAFECLDAPEYYIWSKWNWIVSRCIWYINADVTRIYSQFFISLIYPLWKQKTKTFIFCLHTSNFIIAGRTVAGQSVGPQTVGQDLSRVLKIIAFLLNWVAIKYLVLWIVTVWVCITNSLDGHESLSWGSFFQISSLRKVYSVYHFYVIDSTWFKGRFGDKLWGINDLFFTATASFYFFCLLHICHSTRIDGNSIYQPN